MKNNIIVLVSVIILLAAYFLNVYAEVNLIQTGIQYQKYFQYESTTFKNLFFSFISHLGQKDIINYLIILQLLFIKQKLKVYNHLIFFSFLSYLTDLLKKFHHQPRPFWDDDVLKNSSNCSTDFGFPSNHTICMLIFYEPLLNGILEIKYKKLAFIIYSILTILVLWSRLYLGFHSIYQVIFTILLCLCFLVMYKYKLRQQIHKLLVNLVLKKDLFYYIALFIALFLIFTVIPLLMHFTNQKAHLFSEQNIRNIQSKCHKHINQKKINGKNFSQSSVGLSLFGIIFALILLPLNIKYISYVRGRWNYCSSQGFLKWLVCVIWFCLLPYFLLDGLIKNSDVGPLVYYFLKLMKESWIFFSCILVIYITEYTNEIIQFQANKLQQQNKIEN